MPPAPESLSEPPLLLPPLALPAEAPATPLVEFPPLALPWPAPPFVPPFELPDADAPAALDAPAVLGAPAALVPALPVVAVGVVLVAPPSAGPELVKSEP
jgi:hypothetical protein